CRTYEHPDQLPDGLGHGSVVLLVPGTDESPESAAELLLHTLKPLHHSGSEARLWVLTRRVYEGANLVHAPLFGLARVAAAEHPQL
ncbi:hypothetical protein C6A85_36725, partial [Mycobacterium sp. ITM-2017-0098]